jgi:hypothetical protein
MTLPGVGARRDGGEAAAAAAAAARGGREEAALAALAQLARAGEERLRRRGAEGEGAAAKFRALSDEALREARACVARRCRLASCHLRGAAFAVARALERLEAADAASLSASPSPPQPRAARGPGRQPQSRNLGAASVAVLQGWFDAHREWPFPTVRDKEALAAAAGLSYDQVQRWFNNKRMRGGWRAGAAGAAEAWRGGE